MKQAILCKAILDTEEQKVRQNQVILMEGERITAVEDRAAVEIPEEYQVIDLSDHFVMPGLIDAHLHTAFDPTTYLKDSYGDCTIMGLRNAKKDLLAGFTSVRDMASAHYVDIAVRNAIQRGDAWGPRMSVSGWALSSTGGHGDLDLAPHITGENLSLCKMVDSPDEARRMAREIIKHHTDCLKLCASGGIMSEGDMPGVQKFTQEEMRAAIEVAEMEGLPSAAHAHGASAICAAVKAGITSIEHGTMADEEGIRLMAEHGTYLVPTIIASQSMLSLPEGMIPPFMLYKAKIASAHHREVVARALREGVLFAFGTDAGSTGNEHGDQAREFGYLVDYGLTPMQALLSATINAARLLRTDKEVGSFKAGKFADIVAMKGNPLADVTATEQIDFVMKGGIVYKQKNQPTFPLLV